MPESNMIVAIVVANAIVLIVALMLRTLNLRSLHRIVTVAIDKGSPDTPALIQRLGQGPRINLRLIGYVLVAIALAILGVGLLEGNLRGLKEAVAPAMFPGFVSAAILLYLRRQDRVGAA